MKTTLVTLFLICNFSGFSQTEFLFLNREFNEVSDTNLALYKRKIIAYNEDESIKVIDYHVSGEKYFEGNVVYVNSGLPIGDFKYFHRNGIAKWVGILGELKPSGLKNFYEKQFYSNGQLRCVIEGGKSSFNIIESFDSLGVTLIKKGDGMASFENDYDYQIWSGPVKNHQMDGEWKVTDLRTQRTAHVERYKDGYFKKGVTFFKDNEIQYRDSFGHVTASFRRRVRSLVKTEILRTIPSNQRQKFYKVAVIFRNGRPVEIKHLRKNLGELEIKFDKVTIPDYTFISRGIPIESITVGLKLVKVK